MSRYAVKTRADSPELRKAAAAIEQVAWASLGFVNYTRAHFAYYQQLLDQYADCQLCLVDEETGYPVAVGNCVPLACDFDNLPQEGWDWIVETAACGKKPHNAIGALAISVPGVHRGKGVARIMIQAFHDLARKKGLDGVIAPVRPSEKWRHPFVAIEDYIGWTDERGRAYDPSTLVMLAVFLMASGVAELAARWRGGQIFNFLELHLSPYKGLSYALQVPEAKVIDRRWSSSTRLHLVRSSAIRSFPGLSFTYSQTLPVEDGLFIDGDDLSPVVHSGADLNFTAFMPASVALRLKPAASVLVLEPRGGLDVLTSLAGGARSITAVEADRQVFAAVPSI